MSFRRILSGCLLLLCRNLAGAVGASGAGDCAAFLVVLFVIFFSLVEAGQKVCVREVFRWIQER